MHFIRGGPKHIYAQVHQLCLAIIIIISNSVFFKEFYLEGLNEKFFIKKLEKCWTSRFDIHPESKKMCD